MGPKNLIETPTRHPKTRGERIRLMFVRLLRNEAIRSEKKIMMEHGNKMTLKKGGVKIKLYETRQKCNT